MKCPPNPSRQGDINSDLNPNLKVTRTQTLTLHVKRVGLHLALAVNFVHQNHYLPTLLHNKIQGALYRLHKVSHMLYP